MDSVARWLLCYLVFFKWEKLETGLLHDMYTYIRLLMLVLYPR